jgi:hypothetical protein
MCKIISSSISFFYWNKKYTMRKALSNNLSFHYFDTFFVWSEIFFFVSCLTFKKSKLTIFKERTKKGLNTFFHFAKINKRFFQMCRCLFPEFKASEYKYLKIATRSVFQQWSYPDFLIQNFEITRKLTMPLLVSFQF